VANVALEDLITAGTVKGQTAIDAAIAALVASAPSALNTLKELSDALGADANYAATITTALGNKQPLDSDLTAIAALATTSYGRALLALADAAALTATHSHTTGSASSVLTGGPIPIASGGTADILTLSLAAGTWLVFGNMNVSADSGVAAVTAKIWDGATIYGAGDSAIALASYRIQLTAISVPIVLAAPTTIKWTATSQSPISAIRVNDVSPNATDPVAGVTSLVAIRLA
jgi:hypothetical protein